MTCGAMNGVYLHNNADKRNLEIKFRVNWFVNLILQT